MVRIEHSPDKPAGIKGFLSKKTHKLKKLLYHHKFAGKFLELKRRVVEANERRRRYEVDGSTSATTTSDLLLDPRLPALYSGLDELVGIEGPRNCIINLLTNEADSGSSTQRLKVLPVVGCGGLGKTTLAKQELNIKDYLYWVPEWTRMLSSLVHLCLSIAGIGEEDMQVLEGILTLLFLRLQLKNPPQLRLVIGSEGFKHLNELHVFCTYSAMPLMFVPGAMPELHRLRLEFQARETMSMYGDFDFGIEHLLGLQNVKVEIGYFSGDTDMEAVAAKDAITTASIIHPNRPLLDVRIHVTMLFIIRERAQLTGLQSATNEVNEEMDFQGDLDNPEVSQKLLQLVSSKSFEAEPE
ncbi:hypothetical protein E2562_009918 [Oryza meyeriana var. granulata]|uniref:Disease resistance R13L4/SHOC-2-like LRR domain-containing protein n=1 Tax=Oryza meyeriana var. granulata TaxID=110450 RepID=A0A6G1BU37_9ORYZ|nr:hypothetical protein E2562_009918 [Oryza meyeriana var. granulata]